MKYEEITLKSGMKLFHVPTSSPVAQFQLYTPFGGETLTYRDNAKGDGKIVSLQPGSAHYFEHVLFILPPVDTKGNKIKYRTRTPKTKKGLRDGLTMFNQNKTVSCNAYTTSDHTNYWFMGRKNNMQNLDTLLDIVLEPYLPQDRFIGEVGTILDEARRGLNNKDSVHYDRIKKQIFHKHGAKYPVIGTLESIPKISVEDVLSMHDIFYRPSNLTLVVTGRSDLNAIAKVVETKLDELRINEYYAPPEIVGVNEVKDVVVRNNFPHPIKRDDVSLPEVFASWKKMLEPEKKSKEELLDDHLIAKLASIVLFGEGSRSRERLIESGLDRSSFGGFVISSKDYLLFSAQENTKSPERFYNLVFNAGRRAFNEGLDHSEFDYAKNVLMLDAEMDNEFVADLGSQLVRWGVRLGDPSGYFDYFNRLNTITLDEVNQRLPKFFPDKGFSATLMVPEE